jgi:hypothetical protein
MKIKFYLPPPEISKVEIKEKIDNLFSDIGTYKPKVVMYSTYEENHIYEQDKFEKKNLRNKWLDFVSNLTIDFSKDEKESSITALLEEQYDIKDWVDSCKKFDNAIANYFKYFNEHGNFKRVSNESAKHFLCLIPTVSAYSHYISIDADTGYFNLTFKSKDSGLMTVLITERGDLHYSLAERGKKIVKISGTAKIKDPHDFTKFNKVLSML